MPDAGVRIQCKEYAGKLDCTQCPGMRKKWTVGGICRDAGVLIAIKLGWRISRERRCCRINSEGMQGCSRMDGLLQLWRDAPEWMDCSKYAGMLQNGWDGLLQLWRDAGVRIQCKEYAGKLDCTQCPGMRKKWTVGGICRDAGVLIAIKLDGGFQGNGDAAGSIQKVCRDAPEWTDC
ncbi:Hypothetical protein NTJ_15539 [Nesidiocoris tenuis]|uniref:Uncharacterized protein n=1 Tax=Nesidiocoris tenuis TaxID=355587 RepID=A0ABN7BG81_9HEMI|nr:Hypothetical protein NTJ_15539 [Nesidiocoris tenuis]